MNIGVLTSSRADYGIYRPLLKAIAADVFFKLEIISFGTHLSPYHGNTVDFIEKDGFDVKYKIETVIAGDTENSVATSMGLTMIKFSEFWRSHKSDFDVVLCLGDRYEMFAAVSAGIPFNILFAHLHGGERTLGAIDNIFRHSISLASKIHFTACNEYKQRVVEIIETDENVYNVGALGLDNLEAFSLFSTDEMLRMYKIDFNKPTILTTIHPETVSIEKNEENIKEICNAFKKVLNYQIVITMPNADTEGIKYRKAFLELEKECNHIVCIENFGSQGYFSAMNHCSFLLGNTSSGIIEAASMAKYVINVGDRQKGRICSENVFHVPFDEKLILQQISYIEEVGRYNGSNIFYNGGATKKIIKILRGL
ncbi:MAG: UDP-N-acetylglucosamine 2-epimerase (hydrolyzing) [Marinilabiliaceae bacterium]|nr:UDP-N-acetylglucosamine 2-epimerase (hydrolyzing) [Marinilabiliaceae bacterium]